MSIYEATLSAIRDRVCAGKKTASAVLMRGKDGLPAYCLTRRGLIVSATQHADGIYYSHLSSIAEKELGFDQLKYSERSDIGRTIGREIFGDRLLPE